MSRRLTHLSIAFVLLLSSEVWAIGLGDIQLDSALNEPLRAEIALLSATPEELDNLTVTLASAEIFDRYGIDRPFFLQDIEFNVVSDASGNIVQLRSRSPMAEPFLTFLVEANWPSGRLLREYTVLLDPPTYAPPGAQQAPAVTAPTRSTPSDSGRIERPQPAAQPQPARPAPQSPPAPQPARPSQPAPADTTPYDTGGGGDYVVQRGDSLWGIASRMRPDGRLTMNQTMLAIYEANPGAFGGNINVLRSGASLRVPSADEIFQISRGNAFSEVKRQNEAWSSGSDYTPPPAETRPSLTLVPPDEEPAGLAYDDDVDAAEPVTREQEIQNRIDDLVAADVPDQPSLIEIRDNELAALRQELANIRGEVYEPPVEDADGPFVDDVVDDTMAEEPSIDDLFPDQSELDAAGAEDATDDETVAVDADTEAPSTVVRTAPSKPGIVDQILGALTSVWAGIAAALLVVAGLLFWFMRRGRGESDESGPWESLDSDELAPGSLTATETMRAPTPDETIVVVEQDSAIRRQTDATAEMPAVEVADEGVSETQEFASIEDTFSSETAVNLDQTDPVAEADFHMAYGLYDQAADLINGALETDPEDKGLMSKLCEIYFVWGNRDAFVDAAGKLKSAVGDGENSEWDKIVIMGQQIAADHELFAGAGVGAATKAVDLSFDADSGDAGALDMDFGGDDAGGSDVVDLATGDASSVDFLFDDAATDDTAESPTIATTGTEKTMAMPATDEDTVESATIEEEAVVDLDSTAETPTIEEEVIDLDSTAETPTIEEAVVDLEGTSELPSLDETLEQAIAEAGQDSEATAEINLDDLDLDIEGLAETELGSLDDLDETGTNEVLLDDDFADTGAVTGKNPEIDPNSTGVRERLDLDALIDPDQTGEMRLATDETGRSPLLDVSDETMEQTEVSIDESLLDATGMTQVLDEDMTVETASGIDDLLSDDQATLLASLDDDEDDFDFAQTEALPADVFSSDGDLGETGEMPGVDETGEMPGVGGTDVDLDLSDLTAALNVGGGGDTVDQLRDDETVEQPAPSISGKTAEVPTMSLGPEEMSDDLHEARTMTEVGTKLDLARAYVDMGDPGGARSILEEVLDEGDEGQRQQAQQLLDSLPD